MSIVECNYAKVKNVKGIVDYLWDDMHELRGVWPNGTGPKRQWNSTPFRSLNCRALDLISQHMGPWFSVKTAEVWKRHFVATHWLIPYPRDKSLFYKNGKKETQWISLYHRRLRRENVRELRWGALCSTTQQTPTAYRPRERHGHTFKEKGYEWMEDWGISHWRTTPVMKGIPQDSTRTVAAHKATLEQVEARIQLEWNERSGAEVFPD